MSSCDAKIRPFTGDMEVVCEHDDRGHDGEHRSVIRDYAFPGSQTILAWEDGDRRTFRGDWEPCLDPECILPSKHSGRHAT